MKKIVNKLSTLSLSGLLAITLCFSGCKDYLDINYDPNSPAEENLKTDMIIPAVEMNIASTYAYALNVLGGYNVQYYAQQFGTPNYLSYSQFNVSAENGDAVYRQLYQRALGNLNTVKKKAAEEGKNGVLLQAAVLRAYAFQLLVDAFGEVPYSEAFDVSNLAPKYDEGQDIYKGIIQEIDDALAQVKSGDAVTTSFIFPGKSLDDWIGFAYAEKLKLLSRYNSYEDVSSQIQAVIESGKLPESDIQIADCWADASGQANPFYSEERSTWGLVTHNVIGNLALIGSLQTATYTDPRLAAWFLPNKEGNFQGSISGDNLSGASAPFKTTDAWCELVLEYNTPVILISRAEIEFFIAEYYVERDAAKAKAAYEAAITASFATAGVDGAAAHIAQKPYVGIETIGIEKWKALAGINGFEGYTEARRLGFPKFGTTLGEEIYSGSGPVDFTKYQAEHLYTPYKYYAELEPNMLLQRFPYPEISKARNSNAPNRKSPKDKIFWGKGKDGNK